MSNVVFLRRPAPERAGDAASGISIVEDQPFTLRTACAFAALALGFCCTLTMPVAFAFAAFILVT